MSYGPTYYTKILTLAIAPFLSISIGVLCEFAMVLDVYILLSPQEVKSFLLRGQMYTSVSKFIKRFYIFAFQNITIPRQYI